MADFELPAYRPIYPISKNIKPTQGRAKMPGSWGIEQRKTIGQNQTAPEWNVKWILSDTDANILDDFLRDRARNNQYFIWSPPGYQKAKYRCESWTKTRIDLEISDVQATFKRIYDYNNFPLLSAGNGHVAFYGYKAITRIDYGFLGERAFFELNELLIDDFIEPIDLLADFDEAYEIGASFLRDRIVSCLVCQFLAQTGSVSFEKSGYGFGCQLQSNMLFAGGGASGDGNTNGANLTVSIGYQASAVLGNVSNPGFELSISTLLVAGTATGGAGSPVGPFTGDVMSVAALSPYIRAYKYTYASGWGTQYSNPASPPAVAVDSTAFAPNGTAVFMGIRTSPFISAYAWTPNTGFGAKYSDPATAMTGASTPSIAVARDSSTVFAVNTLSPYISAYSWSSSTGFGAKFSNPSPIPQASITEISCSPTGGAISTARTNSIGSQIQTYAFNSSTGFGAAYSNPSVAGAAYSIKWNYQGDTVFATTSGGAYLYAWPWSDATGFGAAYSAPTVSPALSPRDRTLAIAPNTATVLVGKASAPQCRVWTFSKTTGWGAELSSISAGTGNASSTNIAVTGDTLFIGLGATYYLVAYNWSSAGVGTFRSAVGTTSITPVGLDSLHTGT